MDQSRYVYIVILALFVIAGRKFMDAWRDETPAGTRRRFTFGSLSLACFLAIALFEVM